MKIFKFDPLNTKSVTIRHSTVDEAYLAIELNESHDDLPDNKREYYHAKDVPGQSLQSVFNDLEERYKDTDIEFIRTDID